jgi:4-fold beta-flower domain-containing protein
MEWLWTWGGKSFGYRDGDNLWTHDGRHVGRFHGDEIYGADGRYVGELRNKNRLITNTGKKNKITSGFTPYASHVGYVPYVDYVGYVMYVGYEDFPKPDDL